VGMGRRAWVWDNGRGYGTTGVGMGRRAWVWDNGRGYGIVSHELWYNQGLREDDGGISERKRERV
jgi:hypothetical protein